MSIFSPEQRRFAQTVSDLVYCNPFQPRRIELEQAALGRERRTSASPAGRVWSTDGQGHVMRDDVAELDRQVAALTARVRERLAEQGVGDASVEDLRLYEDICLYQVYEEHLDVMHAMCDAALNGASLDDLPQLWRSVRDRIGHLLQIPGVTLPTGHAPEHVFATFFQIRRAFWHIFQDLAGASLPAAELRAQIWQSIFTHDFRRYAQVFYRHMGDYTTLVVGESGTGKELVARAIGRSRYVPFNPRRSCFTEDFTASFYPVNLSALSPTLIESELFGHARGAFTGAVGDRKGYLEQCPELGTVFLDEIGELDEAIQVKLLRVLQTRDFVRLGETGSRQFAGKIIAATNRDLARGMQDGTFRQDFYYRLCSDIIRTPPLREQLAAAPEELPRLLRILAQRMLGSSADMADAIDPLTQQVHDWIVSHLGLDYHWPGNFRELEQCMRNVIIRGHYTPVTTTHSPTGSATDELVEGVRAAVFSADDVLNRYAKLVYQQTGSYVAAAERLGLDRRTVKARVEANHAE